jgi:tight adherence protein C
MEFMAALLLGLAVFVGARAMLMPAPSQTRTRLNAIAEAGMASTVEAGPTLSQRLVRPLVRGLGRLLGMLLPDHLGEWLEAQTEAAGVDMSPATVLTIVACSTGAMGGMTLLAVTSSEGMSTGIAVLLVTGATGLGLGGPMVWLSGRVTRRRAAIQAALPDTLDLVVVSVEAGLGFEAALARITEQADGPLSDELRRVLADMNLGMARRDALQGMALRAKSAGVSSLVTAILQAERTGMGVGTVLRSQASHLRMVRRQRAEEAAMKAPLKMLFPLVFFIFPSLFVVILGPAMLNLMRTLGGS